MFKKQFKCFFCNYIILTMSITCTFVDSLGQPTIRRITKPVDHAEGPVWDNRKNILYFVDIHSGRVYSYNYETEKVYYMSVNGEVGVVIPSRSYPELFILGVNRTVFAVEWDAKYTIGRYKELVTVSNQFPTSRFNDGKADIHGRIWIGTIGFEDNTGVTPNNGILYRINHDYHNPKIMIAPVNVSNGLTWNQANDKFYYIDTPTRKIMQYHYDDTVGTITGGRVIFNLDQHGSVTGLPDGMTIDKDDNLWVALYGGSAVIQIDPLNGTLLKVIKIPAAAVTSVMWGGPDLDILFVTTSRYRLNKEQRLQQPWAGSVFALENLGTSGCGVFTGDIINFI